MEDGQSEPPTRKGPSLVRLFQVRVTGVSPVQFRRPSGRGGPPAGLGGGRLGLVQVTRLGPPVQLSVRARDRSLGSGPRPRRVALVRFQSVSRPDSAVR